jgi:glycosyltransferase involved in cell wall biosynthesis
MLSCLMTAFATDNFTKATALATARELPRPMPGKTGWPWVHEKPDQPSASARPKITIVTPSYNQGAYLEETIRSVLLQNYPNLEYIVMDGGSTDGSVEIIRKYSGFLSHWESRRDDGQADAIARGFARSRGEILGWLNSDDLLLPGCLEKVARVFANNPDCHCVSGGCVMIDAESRTLSGFLGVPLFQIGVKATLRRLVLWKMDFSQMSCFWRRSAYEKVGGFDTSLKFAFDYDLFLRLARLGPFSRSADFFSCFRVHDASKTSTISDIGRQEVASLRERFQRYVPVSFLSRWERSHYQFSELFSRRLAQLLVSTRLKRFPQLSRPATTR